MLYRISVAERGLTGIANIFRSRLSRLDDLLRAGTVPLSWLFHQFTLVETSITISLWISVLNGVLLFFVCLDGALLAVRGCTIALRGCSGTPKIPNSPPLVERKH